MKYLKRHKWELIFYSLVLLCFGYFCVRFAFWAVSSHSDSYPYMIVMTIIWVISVYIWAVMLLSIIDIIRRAIKEGKENEC